MPRAATTKSYVNFTRGKITEASALTFPEDAAKDLCNIDLEITGAVKRRLGLDYEVGFSLSPFDIPSSDLSAGYTSIHLWESVNSDANVNFLVIKVSATLYFYDVSVNPISNGFLDSISIQPFFVNGVDAFQEPIDAASGKGVLFMAGESLNPFYVSYDGNAFSLTGIDMKVRDFDGVEDGLAVDERPENLTPEHEYNLRNASWDQEAKVWDKAGFFDLIEETKAELGVYPALIDIWYLAKLPEAAKDGEEAFKPDLLPSIVFGNTPAPNGHYVLDLFTKDRSAVSGVPGIDQVIEERRPRTVEFFAGRVWYTFKNEVYFSPILDQDSLDKAGNFFQEQDPTAEEFNALLDTDGGVAAIPEMGTGLALIPLENAILVLANNGIWSVSSGDGGGGFKPGAPSIDKLTDIGVISADTVVKVESSIFYWSDGGIYVLKPDQITGRLAPTNISILTIQSDYFAIKNIARLYAKSFYDRQFKKIFWFYNDDPNFDGFEFKNQYNHVLIFDVSLSAFYDYKIESLEDNSPFISGAFLQSPLSFSEQALVVCVGNDVVCVGDDQVVIGNNILSNNETAIKLVTFVPSGGNFKLTFSAFTSREFKDWVSADSEGISYDSYLETGFELLGDFIRDKQATYVFCAFNRTETFFVDDGQGGTEFDFPSGCNLLVKWDWTGTSNATKWFYVGDVYRLKYPFVGGNPGDPFDYSYDVIETKTKVRGRGKAVHFRFESIDCEDFQLLGWSIPYTSTTVP